MKLTIELTDDQIYKIAEKVADLLGNKKQLHSAKDTTIIKMDEPVEETKRLIPLPEKEESDMESLYLKEV